MSIRSIERRFWLLATISAGLAAGLAVLYGLFPTIACQLFGIAPTGSALFMARRAALFLAGLSALMTLLRDLPPGARQFRISVAAGAMLAAVAALGIWEVARGVAGAGIWGAIAVECTLALSFGLYAPKARRI
jgi:hypothetical protein